MVFYVNFGMDPVNSYTSETVKPIKTRIWSRLKKLQAFRGGHLHLFLFSKMGT